MTGIASKSQLRMSYLRFALFTVPLILLLGIVSGRASNSGYGNAWFDALVKPELMPPGATFAIAWTILYVLLGLSIAIILNARGDGDRLHRLELVAAHHVEAADPLARALPDRGLGLAGHAGDGPGGAVQHLHEIVEQAVLRLHLNVLLVTGQRMISVPPCPGTRVSASGLSCMIW